jgi:hypothetical protein
MLLFVLLLTSDIRLVPLDVVHDVRDVDSRMTNGDLSFGC